VIKAIVVAFLIAAQDPTISVPSDQNFQFEGRYLPLAGCVGGPSANANFLVGGYSLQVPVSSLKSITPVRVNATGSVDRPEQVSLNIPTSAGCPESPLEAAVVAIDDGRVGLPFGLVLAGRRPGATSQSMAALRDSGRCEAVTPDFVGCKGSVQVGGQPVPVVALIAKTATASGGGALFAICEVAEEQTLCEVQGGFETLSYKGMLTPGLPTLESLAAADAAAFDLLRTVR
jgi:hypothetical protein